MDVNIYIYIFLQSLLLPSVLCSWNDGKGESTEIKPS